MTHRLSMRRVVAVLAILGPFPVAQAARAPLTASVRAVAIYANANVTGTVTDSTTGQPLQSAEVSLTSTRGNVVSNTVTNTFGQFTIHNVAPGSYTLSVHMLGFRPMSRPVTIGASTTTQSMNFAMSPIGLNLEAMHVTATAAIAVDTRTGDQVFKQNDYHGAPTNTTSQILQESIAGAARAPTGEVHIRGQHAEYTYYIDGVPVPPGISGSLNELFDPEVVKQINFQTGGWDAEYGGRIAAVVNVTTKIPSGGFHGSASTFAGTFQSGTTVGPTGFNGQSLTASTNSGPWGFFVSGARQSSDMRLDPVVFDTTGDRIVNFHNNGTDYYGFGKVQYAPSVNDVFALDMNTSQTNFAVPFDSSGGTFQNDHQKDQNSFINLGWHHQSTTNAEGRAASELFAGFFYRNASLHYNPDPKDQPQFVFYPDVKDTFSIAENRNANIYGVKLDYSIRPANELEFKFGTLASQTSGHEDFSTFNSMGVVGPQSNSGLSGHDVGAYAQTAWSPAKWAEIRTGVRYDTHQAPNESAQSQVSPRFRLNLYPSTSTTVYGYYGRLFMPTNIEDLRAITSAAQGGEVNQGTVPERDHFFEAGLIQRFPSSGFVTKLSVYHKRSDPGIDDNTVPGSNIVTDVNITHIQITGLESVIEYRPNGPVSGYINAALNHAYGFGNVTGGFFPDAPPSSPFFDLDHDQRLSIVGNLTYSPNRFYVSGTTTYGSGLTNGKDPAECGCEYGTGLFDFNAGTHVPPSMIFNASAGYTFILRGSVFQPEVYVDNVLNKKYLLKGAFFSGASVGRPRSIQLRLKASF